MHGLLFFLICGIQYFLVFLCVSLCNFVAKLFKDITMSRRHFFWSNVFICIILSILLLVSCKQEEDAVKYKDANLPVEERVEDLLSRMTLEEKIEQLSGLGFETKENKRLGIPVLKMADGPVGVRHGQATAFPAAVGLAATWNTQLVEKIGAAIAMEAKSKGLNYLLGPCVNIHRHPLGGRNFESYGEDPFLASRLAVAFVKGVQSEKVLASIKHFACNNQEWERFKLDVTVEERALREIYLPAFKAAVKEADVWTVMAAYNKLWGDYCSENRHLLVDILKEEWGFRGFVVSDWGGTHSTINAANNGLDLEMPYGKFFNEKLLGAVEKGEVSEAVIDDKIRRLLRVRFKAGLFDQPPLVDETVVHREEHKQLALEAAKQSIVLLKNEGNVLPLDKNKIKSLALLGPNAAEARIGGGGSSKVTPFYSVSPLESLEKALGSDIAIKYAPGTAIRGDIIPLDSRYMVPVNTTPGKTGLWAEYFPNIKLEGKPVLTRLDKQVNFNWGYDAPHPALHRPDDRNIFSIRWTGKLLPPKTGEYNLEVIHNDGLRLYVGDQLLIDNWKKNRIVYKTASIGLKAGRTYSIKIEYFFDGGISVVKFGWRLSHHDYLAEAVELAKNSDAVVIFVGLHNRFESEGFDRRRLDLPGQDILIKAVAGVNRHTIVVLNTGTPVLMGPWLDKVAAVVQAWYPGQEGGIAIADVLVGNSNPSGKLPFSFIKSTDDAPAFKDYKDKSLSSPYSEGIFVGYRYLDKHGIEALFPFGHGLSYTRFEYSNLRVTPPEVGVGEGDFSVTVNVDVRNTGKRKGAEVVQVYVKDVECSVERPVKELKGFEKVYLEPGEKKTISIKLNRDAFAFYDPDRRQWVVEPGEFEILVGRSCKDIRLKGLLTVKMSVH
jgi:beta-glucosidase